MPTTEELIVTCPRCEGKGRRDPYRVDNNTSSFGVQRVEYEMTCQQCHGSGKVLTEAGKSIAEVVRHVKAYG